MKQRVLAFLLIMNLLAACSNKTALEFVNETQCGKATITLENKDSGELKKYTVDQGKTLEIEADPGVAYHYKVDYAGPGSADIKCDSKEVDTLLPKGQTLTVKLTNSVDPALQTKTPQATPQ